MTEPVTDMPLHLACPCPALEPDSGVTCSSGSRTVRLPGLDMTTPCGEGIKGSSIKSTIINVNKNKMAEATGRATSAMRLTN